MKKLMLVLVLCLIPGLSMAQGTIIIQGKTSAGKITTAQVDATGALVLSATVSGLMGIKGADGAAIMGAANPLVCSYDGTAVSTAHPYPVRLSADGTNLVDTTHPLPVRPSADGTNPVSAANPLPISGNASPNAQSNRLYVMAGYCLPDLNPASTNYAACTGADQTITLPDATSWWSITLLGASGAMTIDQAASLTGEGMPIPEGVPIGPIQIDSTALHVICTSAAGKIWTVKCKPLP